MNRRPFGPPSPPLGDERTGIVLRPWRADDAPALLAAWRDPAIAATCGVPSDASAERAAKWIAGWRKRSELGASLDLVVADSGADAVLGEVGLWPFVVAPGDPAVDGALELGWWIAAPHRGARRASVAVRLFADWALGALGPERLVARIGPGQAGSEAVARHAGLSHSGPLGADHALWVRVAATMPI